MSCKTDYGPFLKSMPGDYSEGKDGWQLRLYKDSTFYLQKNIYFEMYPYFSGKWSIIRKHPNFIELVLDKVDTSLLIRCCTQQGIMSANKWTVEILDENLLQVRRNDTIDGAILNRQKIHSLNNDRYIFEVAHSTK